MEAYRLNAERVPVSVEDGPSVEVERIGSWFVYRRAVDLVGAFFGASGPEAERAALLELFGFFVAEARPAWLILDHLGPVAPTVAGCCRLPLAMALAIVDGWTETYRVAEPTPTAVDAIIPPGPLRDELNAGLREAQGA